MEGVTSKRLTPAFGRRSKQSSVSGIDSAKPAADDADKSDSSARWSLPVDGGDERFQSILSFIAAKEHDTVADAPSQPPPPLPQLSAETTTSASPPSSSPLTSAPAPSPHHSRSLSATTSFLPSSSSSSPSSSGSSTPLQSPFAAYKEKVQALNATISSLHQQLVSMTQSHASAMSSLQSEHKAALVSSLSFSEQLLADKRELTERVAELTAELGRLEERAMTRCVELQLECDDKARAAIAAGIKDWKERELKAVKASVVKQMKDEVDAALRAQRDEHDRSEAQWREKLKQQRDDAERELAHREHQLRQQQSEQRERDKQRHDQRQADAIKAAIERCDKKEVELRRQHDTERHNYMDRCDQQRRADQDKAQQDRQRDMERVEAEWQQRLAAVKAQCEDDKVLWVQRREVEYETRMKEREAVIKERVRADSEAELEHVIQRLGDESLNMQQQDTRRHQDAVTRLKHEAAQDLTAQHERHAALTHKYNALSQDNRAKQDEIVALTRRVAELELAVEDCRTKESKAKHAVSSSADDWQDELNKATARWERESKSLQQEHQAALQHAAKQHELTRQREMSALQQRVADTVAKKDGIILQLQRQLRVLQGDALRVERMIGP